MGRISHNACPPCKGGIVSRKPGEPDKPCHRCNKEAFQQWEADKIAREGVDDDGFSWAPRTERQTATRVEHTAQRSAKLKALRAKSGL